jgi:predicted RNA binding protein YcfA (HicA-like mRNA interferase family)
MSSSIPRITGEEALAAFERAGFAVVRIKGSHHIMKRGGWPNRLSIPVHSGKTIGKGLLATQIDKAGLTLEEFCALLG